MFNISKYKTRWILMYYANHVIRELTSRKDLFFYRGHISLKGSVCTYWGAGVSGQKHPQAHVLRSSPTKSINNWLENRNVKKWIEHLKEKKICEMNQKPSSSWNASLNKLFHVIASVQGRRNNNNQCLAVSNTSSYVCCVSPLATVD